MPQRQMTSGNPNTAPNSHEGSAPKGSCQLKKKEEHLIILTILEMRLNIGTLCVLMFALKKVFASVMTWSLGAKVEYKGI